MNEITAPVADYAAARIGVLNAVVKRTAAEKRELALLKSLAKTLGRTQAALRGDYAELTAAAKSFAALKTAGAPMQPSLDEAFLRANVTLSERVELLQDHLDLIPTTQPKFRKPVQTSLTSIATARTKAAAATTPAKRAAFMASADALVTKGIKTAQTYVSKIGTVELPPHRFRSGDAIDQRGGRVAIPRDAASAMAGASIVIPGGVFQAPQIVTLSVAPSFVGGRDAPAWNSALAVTPDVLPPGAVATVFVPFSIGQDQTALNLALFVKGPPAETIRNVALHPNDFLSADVSSFSTFQSGFAAPPRGQPNGTYHVQMFVIETAVDTTNTDLAGVRGGLLSESITFRIDHTGATAFPGYQSFARTFKTAAPHHLDETQSAFVSPADFAWQAEGVGQGRFSFTFRINALAGPAQGVASDDGRVISFSGRAGTIEFFGVGVTGGANGGVADLAGRWAAVETGVQLMNDGAEPFTTRRFDAFRVFNVDAAGAVAFDGGGTRFETDATYATDQLDPVHSRTENVVADSGTESWSLSAADGRLSDGASKRSGWFDKEAGFLVSTHFDAATRRVSLMLAVPQPAAATPSAVPGLYHLSQLDVGTTVGAPTARSSTYDATPSVGSLDVASVSAATLAFDATTRNVYTLSGDPPISSMTWALTVAPVATAASSSPVALLLDAAGNHTVAGDERWFAFSGDGRYVLSLTRGETARLARGIGLGVK